MAILPAWVANQNTEFALSSLATESAIYLTCNKKCSSKKWNKKNIYQGGTPDFKRWGWLNGGKNQNQKKIPRASKETPQKSLDQNLSPQKSLAEFPRHKNFQKTLNDITWKERHKFWIPKKILAKIFLPQKILGSSLSLEIQIIPPPPRDYSDHDSGTMNEPWINRAIVIMF